MANESAWSFSYKEFSHFFAFFHSIVPEGGLLTGSRAKEFFLLSNLAPPTLSHIWELSDVDGDGQLNASEFSLAINFCQLALDGLQPPASLPNDLQLLWEQTTQPDKHVAAMKTSQLEKCVSVFLSFVENNGGSGYLAAEAARYLLTNSQLPKAVLYHIWKLSDGDKDGRLNFKEFVVAMHLVFIAKLNQPLPITLEPAKVLPPEFSAMEKKISNLVDQKPLCSNRGNHPVIPNFVIPINNPCIATPFKDIPPDGFLNGKFDNSIGNPFKTEDSQSSRQTLNGSHQSTSSQEDLSHSSRRSSTESGDISKLSSASQHSSIKSLVEERDKPLLQLAESVELQSVDPAQGEEPDDEEMDPVEREKMEVELKAIAKVTDDYLEKNSKTTTTPPPPSSVIVIGPDTTKGPESKISLEPAPVVNKPPTPVSETPGPKPGPKPTQMKGIDLSFLDDLEAQVMDVLDDTISFDPMKATPQPEPVKKPEVKPSPPPPPPRKISLDETDSVFVPSSPNRSKTLPHRRAPKGSSPFEIRTRKTSDERRNTLGTSPLRRSRPSVNNRASLILDDLDDIFSDELAQIDGLMDARKTKNEERKKRIEKETEDLKDVELRAPQANVPTAKLTTMEEVAKRRDEESAQQQMEWEQDFEEKSRKLYDEQMGAKLNLLNDETIHDLEKQFQELIEHEAHQMKDARTIRAQKLKQREQDEIERMERIRQEMKGKNELTIEEWIQMMEEKKLKEMSEEDRVKYHAKKKLWLAERRRKEEERKRIEEEKLRKNRERIEQEYLHQRRIEAELESTRLSKEELTSLEQEQLRKEAEERKMRSEQAKLRMEEMKQKEMEMNKPQARSGIAARWEQKVKGGSDPKGTVMSQNTKSASYREAERLAKRVGNLS